MKPNIYLSIYARKGNTELLSELQKGIANSKGIDARVLPAIKNILASRHLTEPERETFESLTKGETFEKIENAEVNQQPSETDVVLEKPTPIARKFNWVRHIFGGISYMGWEWLYFHGHFPSHWYGAGSYVAGVLVYEMIAFVGLKMGL